MSKKINEAYSFFITLINKEYEFPEAEYQTCKKFRLSTGEWNEIEMMYDSCEV